MQIIYKGKDELGKDKYLVRIFLRRTSSGKRLYHNKLVHGGKRKAEEYGHRAQTQRDLGTLEQETMNDPVLDDYLNTWLVTYKKPTIRERSYEDYEYTLKQYIRPGLGKYKLSELTTERIQRHYNYLTDAEYAPRTIAFAHTLLKEALDQAVIAQYISFNPALKTKRPSKLKSPPKSFTEEEGERFVTEARKDSLGALFIFALAVGARPEEYTALQWTHIDLKKNEVLIQQSIRFLKGGGWILQSVKRKSSIRTVGFDQNVADLLRKHRTAQQKLRMKKGWKYENNDFVFATANGTPHNFRNLTLRHLSPIMVRAKIHKPHNLYRLRHSFVTLSLLSGADPKSVSEAAGHSSVSFTMDVYQSVLPVMRKDAGERIGTLLFKRQSGKKK